MKLDDPNKIKGNTQEWRLQWADLVNVLVESIPGEELLDAPISEVYTALQRTACCSVLQRVAAS